MGKIRELFSSLVWIFVLLWLLLAQYLVFIRYRKHVRRENPHWNLSFEEWLNEVDDP